MAKLDKQKTVQSYTPGELSIARKNGWIEGSGGTPLSYIPFGLLTRYATWPEETPQGAAYALIADVLGKLGLKVTTLASRSPSRTFADVAAAFAHELAPPPPPPQPPPQPGRQGPPVPTTGQPQPGEGEGDGEGEGEGQQPAQQQGAPQPRQRMSQTQMRELVRELAEQEKGQRAQEQQRQHSIDAFKRSQQQQGNSGSHDGGVLDESISIPKDVVKKMLAIMQRMVGGFDLQLTPMWDSSELVKRVVTRQTLDPARRKEEGRPAITFAVDVSGSCEEIAQHTTAVSVAASMAGEYGTDILVFKHSNGILCKDEGTLASLAHLASYYRKTVMASWHVLNGKRMNLWAALTPEERNAADDLHDYGVRGLRYAAHRVLRIPNPPPLTKQNNSLSQDTARVLVLTRPAWVIVYTDTDSMALLMTLLDVLPSETRVAWVDYRTLPNRWDARYQTYATLRRDGQADQRLSGYNENAPTYSTRTNYSTCGESVRKAREIPSLPNAAYTPRWQGDTEWLPTWWLDGHDNDGFVRRVGAHKNGRKLFVVPNADTLWGVIEATKIVATPERLKAATDVGKAVLSMYAERSDLSQLASRNVLGYPRLQSAPT